MISPATELPSPVHHVFVDYENVRAIDPTIIGRKNFHITVLLGAHKSKFDGTVVEQLVQHAATIEIIRLESSGRNALDFALTYYLGRAVLADPAGSFHLISKDKGYDPLIEHLRRKHLRVTRHDDFTALAPTPAFKPAVPQPTAKPVTRPSATPLAKPTTKLVQKVEPKPKVWSLAVQERAGRVLSRLRRLSSKPPRTRARLLSYIIALPGEKFTASEAPDFVEYLAQKGHLTIDAEGKVTYHLDSK